MSDLQTFTCFSRLPNEIRRLIWKHSLPGPRTLGYQLWVPGPIALQVNYESRQLALQHYHKTHHPTGTYIDFSTDAIIFKSLRRYLIPRNAPPDQCPTTSPHDLGKVRSVLFREFGSLIQPFDQQLFHDTMFRYVNSALDTCPNLEEMLIELYWKKFCQDPDEERVDHMCDDFMKDYLIWFQGRFEETPKLVWRKRDANYYCQEEGIAHPPRWGQEWKRRHARGEWGDLDPDDVNVDF